MEPEARNLPAITTLHSIAWIDEKWLPSILNTMIGLVDFRLNVHRVSHLKPWPCSWVCPLMQTIRRWRRLIGSRRWRFVYIDRLVGSCPTSFLLSIIQIRTLQPTLRRSSRKSGVLLSFIFEALCWSCCAWAIVKHIKSYLILYVGLIRNNLFNLNVVSFYSSCRIFERYMIKKGKTRWVRLISSMENDNQYSPSTG